MCRYEKVDSFWNNLVAVHNATRVKYGLLSRGHGKLPLPEEVPNKAIWFEDLDFGWILSARDEAGHRKILVKY